MTATNEAARLPGAPLSLADLVKQFDAGVYAGIVAKLGEARRIANEPPREEPFSLTLTVDEWPLIQEVEESCDSLGLPMTLLAIRRVRAEISHEETSWGRILDLLSDVQRRLVDELSLMQFVVIDPEHARFMQEPHLFGEEVGSRFPSALEDIEEAGKCLALGRGTACVFHLMRVMEVGLRALGDSLRDASLDPASNPSWEKILRRCRTETEKPLAERSVEWKADGPFFTDATARLAAVKDAWRNPTMHVKKDGYTEEQALDIWNHVGAFMRHLATKLSESDA